jgi:Nucleotidyl transferase AbiEii toxin, Type IV TA system
MQLPPDFREFIELMISNNVRFVMIGGYAYNLYRNPRATGDIDFLVAISDANEKSLRKSLQNLGSAIHYKAPS